MIDRRDIDRAAAAFTSRWVQGYVRGKMKSDPIYRIVRELLSTSQRPLVDVGCGLGLLALYFHLSGDSRPVIGMDHDGPKIDAARKAATAIGASRAEFRKSDAREPLEARGDVVLLDLLHYFSDAEQRAIIASAAAATDDGGRLVIRDCLRDSSWRYRVTAAQERFSKIIGWLRGDRLRFPTRESIVEAATSAGLTLIEVRPLWFRTPFNNYLLVFERQ